MSTRPAAHARLAAVDARAVPQEMPAPGMPRLSCVVPCFNEAANLCVGLLTAKIDGLLRKMKTGALSSEEQKVFAELSELKAEMEQRLYAYPSGPEEL